VHNTISYNSRIEAYRAHGINEERVREAAETGATTLAVACPFLHRDARRRRALGRGGLRVADVSTLLAESSN
jgi:hypothetical protein